MFFYSSNISCKYSDIAIWSALTAEDNNVCTAETLNQVSIVTFQDLETLREFKLYMVRCQVVPLVGASAGP